MVNTKETPAEQNIDTEEMAMETNEQNLRQRQNFFDMIHSKFLNEDNKDIEKDLNMIEDFGDDLLNGDEWQGLKDSLYSDIETELKQYDNYDDMLKNIYDVYGKINYDEKVKYLTKLILIANIYGKNAGDNDNGKTK
jgi:phage gp29-like protein